MQDLRYPIGVFQAPRPVTSQHLADGIASIARCPGELRAAVRGLDDARLDTPYREGGWTVRQVVHHLPDSHMNAYIRMKLAATENHPAVKPYHEALWAELADAKDGPVETSLALLECLHARWVTFLRSLAEADFRRALFHPENGDLTLDVVTMHYAWHGRHHVAHVTSLRERMGW